MSTIHIHRRLDSDTLPELQPFVGKIVDITVREANNLDVTPGSGDWTTWPAAAAAMEGYDFDAWKTQREYDVQHADDLP